MFDLTALHLARIQFGFTISIHIIFPAITIGLASYLVVLEGLWLWRKDRVYRSRSSILEHSCHGICVSPANARSVTYVIGS
jgi:cytochrome bd-type quinol oxidase subunit 1